MHRSWFKPVPAVISAILTLGAVTAVAVAPKNARELNLQFAPPEEIALAVSVTPTPNHFLQVERVRRGDTLSSLLARIGALDNEFQQFVQTEPVARQILQMRTGRTVLADLDVNGRVLRFSYRTSGLEEGDTRPSRVGRRVLVERGTEGFTVREEEVELERQLASRYVEVRSNLAEATRAGALPASIAAQLGDVFTSSLDISKDLRTGDTVRVVYETLREAGSFDTPIPGRLLAAEVVAGGHPLQAIWFEPTRKAAALRAVPARAPTKAVRAQGRAARATNQSSGQRSDIAARSPAGDYFDFDGRSLKKSFLRNPLEVSQVMSGFSEARLHPIMRDWRAHKGVDFAAPTGTRVRTVGDGVIDFVGQQRGYGNVVIVRHIKGITTLYAHLSGFAGQLEVGSRVGQGDVIGFVGQTGWATGPHLHYEFRVNEEQADPLTVALPDALPPLDAQDRQRFTAEAAPLIAEIRQFEQLNIARFQ